jgi:hypothetical protein
LSYGALDEARAREGVTRLVTGLQAFKPSGLQA